MSQDSYTFACPACGIHLSVPRSLAGVRGPCPQCHQEITAPQPTERVFPTPFADPPSAAAPPTKPAQAPPALEPAAKPRSVAAWDEPAPPDHAEANRRGTTSRVNRRGSSRWVAACGLLMVIGLAAAAGLIFLPPGTLHAWTARLAKATRLASLAPTNAGSDQGSKPPPVATRDPSTPSPDGPSSPTPTPPLATATVPDQTAPDPTAPDPTAPDPPVPPPIVADADPPTAPPGATSEGGTSTPPAPTESPVTKPPPPVQIAKALDPAGRPTDPPSLLPDLGTGDETSKIEAESATRPGAPASEMAEPLSALKDFLRAPTWKDRLGFCLNPEQVRPEMAEHYSTFKDGPQTYTSALFMASSPLPDPKFAVHVFHVTFPDLPQGFPIPIEQTERGWKIDWRAFVEFRDSRLKKFFAKYHDLPAVFRVQLRRTHYYDKDVPNLDGKFCFRVSAPIDGHDGYVFVDKRDSIAVPKLDGKLEWDFVHHVMVKLKWVKGAGGHSYVELRDITANSWRDESTPRLGQK